MFERGVWQRRRRWLDVLRPDADLAEAEGLAAGLGLLTGEVARGIETSNAPLDDCPTCGGPCAVVVVDLVGHSTTRKCQTCARRWTAADEPDPTADESAASTPPHLTR